MPPQTTPPITEIGTSDQKPPEMEVVVLIGRMPLAARQYHELRLDRAKDQPIMISRSIVFQTMHMTKTCSIGTQSATSAAP